MDLKFIDTYRPIINRMINKNNTIVAFDRTFDMNILEGLSNFILLDKEDGKIPILITLGEVEDKLYVASNRADNKLVIQPKGISKITLLDRPTYIHIELNPFDKEENFIKTVKALNELISPQNIQNLKITIIFTINDLCARYIKDEIIKLSKKDINLTMCFHTYEKVLEVFGNTNFIEKTDNLIITGASQSKLMKQMIGEIDVAWKDIIMIDTKDKENNCEIVKLHLSDRYL